MTAIIGIDVDAAGRCAHYHGPTDIAGMWCAQCQAYFACYKCHDALRDHPFVPASKTQLAVICGVCGHRMDFASYHTGHCPHCGHAFNPRCALHQDRYFRE